MNVRHEEPAKCGGRRLAGTYPILSRSLEGAPQVNTAVSRMVAGLVLGALALAPAALAVEDKPADLKVGDLAPVFGVMDDQGQPWKSADHVGKKYLVFYFFPGDFTRGCTV